MEVGMATTRERLRELLEAVPDARLAEVEAVLVALVADEIPDDDEPFTDEDLSAVAETRAELARGETVSNDVVRREIGW
jgi:hypothetical protein